MHESVLLGRLTILEADVRADVDTGYTVVAQPDSLRETGPHVDHVGHGSIPCEIAAALDDGFKCFAVVVGYFLAGEAGVPCRNFGGKGTHGHAIGYAVRIAVV